ncbi:MAG TPA: aminotransferase class III-fold pyridoxal phosphate-dependent enzyme [Acidimicrobiales bacterium]|nr:aminotransferase class III-fold pyridoxal phosphate-dependent enzyme [Acidimicrobiales bacterium]
MTPEEERYRTLTPTSGLMFAEAASHLPGGDSRSPLFHPPYPVVWKAGAGCRLEDVDGNQLLDFTGNHTSLVLGYGHPAVDEAIRSQLGRGPVFPGTSEPQLCLARTLCERVPSFERVRFTNSGTEAVMLGVRAARAFTGRTTVAKVEGGYNGSVDAVMVSTAPTLAEAGPQARPRAVPGSAGLPPGTCESTVVLPFNDADAATSLVEEHAGDLAAVVVEPVLGSAGMIPADPEYLQALREAATAAGALLVFDEVVSFRVDYGGAQELYGVTPDVTCLGKLVGGGLPLGVVGGRADVMAVFDPTRALPPVPHPGSYNANPLSLAAAQATLDVLDRSAVQRLNARGEEVRSRIAGALSAAGLLAFVTGLGSLFAVHFTAGPVRTYRDAARGDSGLRRRLFLGLFVEGVLIDPRGVGCLSLPVGDPEVERLIAATEVVAARLAE